MLEKARCTRWIAVAAILGLAQSADLGAQAQFWGQDSGYKRSRPQSGGFFQDWFGPSNSRGRDNDSSRWRDDDYSQPQRQHTPQQQNESSRAPPPRKVDSKGDQVAPTTSIVVMGDEMADWLAYGLEDVFSDSPEIGIVRKNKLYSGLLRYEAKSDLDWWHVARDTLAQEKTDYVVMMLGLSDRQEIREKDLAKEAEIKAKDDQAKADAEKKDGQKASKVGEEATAPAQRPRKAGSAAEFRSDEWAKIYSRRIDETIAALKSKGVPVIWVGLPSIRGTRSTSDAAYLNDLYRSRAERAGIAYIDVWDGFVDEAGKFSYFGPDYEGQTRRLRLSDGVFFTKSGAIKLARYVEHELHRYFGNRATVTLPSSPIEPASPDKPAERPLSGPVVPLTGAPPKDGDELLGGANGSSLHGDAVATKVLAKGEAITAPAGRADNFSWPRGIDATAALPAPPATQPTGLPTGASSALASAPAATKQDERKKDGVAKPAGKIAKKSTRSDGRPDFAPPKPSHDDSPRPPMPVGPARGVFGR
jgi:hypothetical protein